MAFLVSFRKTLTKKLLFFDKYISFKIFRVCRSKMDVLEKFLEEDASGRPGVESLKGASSPHPHLKLAIDI